jgi:hypothetical protein
MAGTVRVEGLTRTVRALQTYGVQIDDLKDVMSGIAELGAQLAGRYAPHRTGRLAGTVRGNRAKAKAVVTAGRARVPYAGAINYGWRARGIRPALFMQRADAELAPRAIEMLQDGLDQAARKAGLDVG